MIYNVTTYRNHLIQYDEDNNAFIIDINDNDSVLPYLSMFGAKTAIDKFTKFNTAFVQFDAFIKYHKDSDNFDKIRVVNIQDNGTLVYMNDDASDITRHLEVRGRHLLYKFDENFITNMENLRDKYFTERKNMITSLIPMDLSHLR